VKGVGFTAPPASVATITARASRTQSRSIEIIDIFDAADIRIIHQVK